MNLFISDFKVAMAVAVAGSDVLILHTNFWQE
jgi:hypothetical protein